MKRILLTIAIAALSALLFACTNKSAPTEADVSVNIYAFLKAQETGQPVELSCAIGDTTIDGKPYADIVEIARRYINDIGGFEKFAEWGLF